MLPSESAYFVVQAGPAKVVRTLLAELLERRRDVLGQDPVDLVHLRLLLHHELDALLLLRLVPSPATHSHSSKAGEIFQKRLAQWFLECSRSFVMYLKGVLGSSLV